MQVAWSVHYCYQCSGPGDTWASIWNVDASGRFQFNVVEANVGAAYNLSTNTATIPFNGIYYISYVSTPYSGNSVLSLYLNGNAISSIYRYALGNKLGGRERSMLLKLSVGDQMCIKQVTGNVGVGWRNSISFMGLLLMPI